MRLIYKLMILFLLLDSHLQAGVEQSVVIWNSHQPQVQIPTSTLESLGGHSFAKSLADTDLRAPLRWYRLRIDNTTDQTYALQLSSQDPAMHGMWLVAQPNGPSDAPPQEIMTRRDRWPDATHRRLRLNIELKPGLQTYYLGISSFLDMANLQLIPAKLRQTRDSRFTLFAGFMLGGITLMMLSALLLYGTTGHRLLLLYAFHAFTLLPLLLNLSGLFGLILSPEWTDWFERHLAMTGLLAIVGLLEFALAVFDIKAHKPHLHTFLRLQSGAAILLLLVAGSLGTDRGILGLTQVSVALAFVSLLVIGLQLSWQSMRSARFFLSGLGVFLLSSTVTLLGSLDIDTTPLDPVLCMLGGAVLQVSLMPFGIYDRLRSITQEKDQKTYQLQEAQALIQLLTHDLAGPLFVIQSMAELQAEKSGMEPRLQQAFARICTAAQSAQSMLKVVKELEAIESGKVELTLKPVPLLAALNTAIESLRPKAEAKQIPILVQADIPDKVMVLGERSILENTIFHNVMANAIKFSRPNDPIEISVSLMDKDRIAIRIKDRGIGIPDNLISKLFSHSSKTTRKGTVGEKGTGFGLPLTQRYVQKFGGIIEVVSQAQEIHPDDHWTQFTITLQKAA